MSDHDDALAQTVDTQQRLIDLLTGRLARLEDEFEQPGAADVLGRIAERLNNHQALIDAQQEQLGDLGETNGGTRGLDGAVLPQRYDMLDTDADRENWKAELAAWVSWLVYTYRLEGVPACWWRHPALVEELTAAWFGWKGAWIAPSYSYDAMRWHAEFASALDRIEHRWHIHTANQEHEPDHNLNWDDRSGEPGWPGPQSLNWSVHPAQGAARPDAAD